MASCSAVLTPLPEGTSLPVDPPSFLTPPLPSLWPFCSQRILLCFAELAATSQTRAVNLPLSSVPHRTQLPIFTASLLTASTAPTLSLSHSHPSLCFCHKSAQSCEQRAGMPLALHPRPLLPPSSCGATDESVAVGLEAVHANGSLAVHQKEGRTMLWLWLDWALGDSRVGGDKKKKHQHTSTVWLLMAQLTKSGENSYLWSLKFYWLFYEPFLACLPKHGNRTLQGEHENSRLSQVNDHNSSQQFWFSHSDCLLNLTSKLWAQLNIWIIGISKFVKLFFWVPAWKTNIWEQWRLLYCWQGELPSFPPVSRLRFSSQARGCQIPRRWADPDIFTNARTRTHTSERSRDCDVGKANAPNGNRHRTFSR